MQPIEPALMGDMLDAIASADTEDEYIRLALAAYKQAYDLDELTGEDEARLRDIFNRLNAFQALRADPRFEPVFMAHGNLVFAEIAACIVAARYTLDEAGMASFEFDEIMAMFLDEQGQRSN